jgi:hypothetical protein
VLWVESESIAAGCTASACIIHGVLGWLQFTTFEKRSNVRFGCTKTFTLANKTDLHRPHYSWNNHRVYLKFHLRYIPKKRFCTIVVGIATRLRAGRSGVRIPAEARGFPHLQNVRTDSRAHPASYSMVTGVHSRN